jgi:hypothetical protein
LPVLLDRLEEADGAAEPVPSADGWELVLAENVAYLVDDERRWRALALGGRPGPSGQVDPRHLAHLAGVA